MNLRSAKNTSIIDAMNIVGRVALVGLVLIIVSCQPKSPLSDVTGNVNVLIPKPNQSSTDYTLEPVQLNDIKVLKEMRGNYAEFFYAPGSNEGSLYGTAPRARYAKSPQGFYIPLDLISSQMATIYFHLQNLIQLNESVDLQNITRKPFQVGLEVRKTDRDKLYEKNNAFYDGYSDSMLFLPMNSSELSLALNAGVIAHEFFHSIFYKKVLGQIKFTNKTIKAENIKSVKDEAELFNLTYARGLNEGLADFWGWLYTKDKNFMSLSFIGEEEGRSLNLHSDEIGVHQHDNDIQDRISLALENETQTNEMLLDYIYLVGTPHARFLRQLVDYEANSVISQKAMFRIESDEKKWILIVVEFLDQLSSELKSNSEKMISAARLFEYVGERSLQENLLNLEQCKFVIRYLGQVEELTPLTAKKLNGQTVTCDKKTNSEAYEITTR